ncbi:MAG: SGNH/GDSL hydrolase family protein [Clostridiales bacterium]|nr:SGNH/GDSL hydrolase family protein [Clostridiales bacterium]
MKHKKNIWHCAGFLLGLVIILALLSCVFRRKDGIYVYDALSVSVKSSDIKAEPDNSLDVIFYGDSEAYSSFSPNHLYSKFGYTSFCCGTAAQKVCDTYALLTEAFKTQSPKVIVLEANCLYRTLNEEDNKKDIVMNFLTDSVPVFANHSTWKLFVRKALPSGREKRRRGQKGFVLRKDSRPYKGGKYMKKTKKADELSSDVTTYLNKIATLCKENNAELLIVSTPSPRNWTYKKHNGVQSWASLHGVTYIDLNLDKDIKINWKKDTKDSGDHLNYSGAKKVTNYMGKYFRDHYNLTDHRE